MAHKIIKSKIYDFIKLTFIGIILFGFALGAWSDPPNPAQDLLAGAKVDVVSNFGPTSTLAYIIYLIEVISGVAAYIKSKNLFALIGVIVVVIFTTAAFAMIGT